ncbi:universal stress protein [Psychrobacter aestuarii]|uniref:Universal stress protein n=1 Tax=Psychrobacter aestuarii TaxID=556327 RepID=A0ABN0VSP5_9GAMM|nr:universal stress protein [Psychrobacter aestuarii]
MTIEQHILACIDGSKATDSVCDYAAWYARKLALPISLLHVSDLSASKISELSDALGIDNSNALLRLLIERDANTISPAANDSDDLTANAKRHLESQSYDAKVYIHQHDGKLLPAIEYLSDRTRAIVMARREEGRDANDATIGDHIERVVRKADVPVLICSEPFAEPNAYLIAFDASDIAIKTTDMIANSPLLKSMQGHIVMVGDPGSAANARLADATDKLRAAGFQIEPHNVPEAPAVDGLLDFQEKHDIDIIVVGAYSRPKLQQWLLGSTTTDIIANTSCPVLLVH